MPQITWPQAVAIAAAAFVLQRTIPAAIDFVGYMVERRDERSLLVLPETIH